MTILFFIVILLLILVAVYQFIPTLQIHVDSKWGALSNKIRQFNSFVDDDAFEIPDMFQPSESVNDFYQRRSLMGRDDWGGPHRDGPDRSMVGHCWWISGMLYCKHHPLPNIVKPDPARSPPTPTDTIDDSADPPV